MASLWTLPARSPNSKVTFGQLSFDRPAHVSGRYTPVIDRCFRACKTGRAFFVCCFHCASLTLTVIKVARALRETSTHRKLRRLRTRARTLLRAAAAGWVVPSPLRIITAQQILAKHHSFSRMSAPSWQCVCKQWVKGSMEFCGACGAHWSVSCHGSGYAQYTATASKPPWRHTEQWSSAASWKRPKSPRRRKPSLPRAPGGQQDRTASGSAPLTSQLPKAPVPKPGTAPKQVLATAPVAESQDKKVLDQLLDQLRSSREELPASIKDIVDRHGKESHAQATKNLHKAVSSQAQAKREISSLQAARQDYLASWQEYVQQLAEIWETQVAERDRVLGKWTPKRRRGACNCKRLRTK